MPDIMDMRTGTYMMKEEGRLGKKWQKRWVVYYHDPDHHPRVEYFTNNTMKNRKGTISWTVGDGDATTHVGPRLSTHPATADMAVGTREIEIVCPERTHRLRCGSAEDFEQWRDVLQLPPQWESSSPLAGASLPEPEPEPEREPEPAAPAVGIAVAAGGALPDPEPEPEPEPVQMSKHHGTRRRRSSRRQNNPATAPPAPQSLSVINLGSSQSADDQKNLLAMAEVCGQLLRSKGDVLRVRSVEDLFSEHRWPLSKARADHPEPQQHATLEDSLDVEKARRRMFDDREELWKELQDSIQEAQKVEDEHNATVTAFDVARTSMQGAAEKITDFRADLDTHVQEVEERHEKASDEMERKLSEQLESMQADIRGRTEDVNRRREIIERELRDCRDEQERGIQTMMSGARQDIEDEMTRIDETIQSERRTIDSRVESEKKRLDTMQAKLLAARQKLEKEEHLVRERSFAIIEAAGTHVNTFVHIRASDGKSYRWRVDHVIKEPGSVLAKAFHDAHKRHLDGFSIDPRDEEAFARLDRYWRFYVEHEEQSKRTGIDPNIRFAEFVQRHQRDLLHLLSVDAAEAPLQLLSQDARAFGLFDFQGKCESLLHENEQLVKDLGECIRGIRHRDLSETHQKLDQLRKNGATMSGHKRQLEKLESSFADAKSEYFEHLMFRVGQKQFARLPQVKEDVQNQLGAFHDTDPDGFLREWRKQEKALRQRTRSVAEKLAACRDGAGLEPLNKICEELHHLTKAFVNISDIVRELEDLRRDMHVERTEYVERMLESDVDFDFEKAAADARRELEEAPYLDTPRHQGGQEPQSLVVKLSELTQTHHAEQQRCIEASNAVQHTEAWNHQAGSWGDGLDWSQVNTLFSDLKHAQSIGTKKNRESAKESTMQLCRHLTDGIQQSSKGSATHLKEGRFEAVAEALDGLKQQEQHVAVDDIQREASKALKRVQDDVHTHSSRMQEEMQQLFEKALDSDSPTEDDMQAVTQKVETLQRFDVQVLRKYPGYFEVVDQDQLVQQLNDITSRKGASLRSKIVDGGCANNTKMLARELLQLYRAPSDIVIPGVKEHAFDLIGGILQLLTDEYQTDMDKLAAALEHTGFQGRGNEIIDHFVKFFRDFQIKQMQSATSKLSPEDCLTTFRRDNPSWTEQEVHTLSRVHAAYHEFYERELNAAVQAKYDPDGPYGGNRPQLRDFATTLLEKAQKNPAHVVASICAVWSMSDLPPDSSTCKRPHAVQIFSIFRLLALHIKHQQLDFPLDSKDSRLIQVKTGQGKSVLLGVLATALALGGYDVDCVCYSEYLSRRDYSGFEDVFRTFGVEGHIAYDTINELAKKTLFSQHTRDHGPQELTHRLLNGNLKRKIKASRTKPRQKVLLIDEVDMFLSQDFYGNTYNPVTKPAQLECTSSVGNMQELIWQMTKGAQTGILAKVKAMREYKDVQKRLGTDLQPLIDGHLRQMIAGAKAVHRSELREEGDRKVFVGEHLSSRPEVGLAMCAQQPCVSSAVLEPEPEPELEMQPGGARGQAILYPDQDQMRSDMFYGYETSFCYYKARDDGHDMEMDAANGFRISCGNYSYAEMARTGSSTGGYACMLGVTGTLESMNTFEKNVVRTDFGVQHLELAPSMYGDSQLQFFDDSKEYVTVEPEEGHQHRAIADKLRKALEAEFDESRNIVKHGAALVFFDTPRQMNRFRRSQYCTDLEQRSKTPVNVQMITSEMDLDTINGLVVRAVRGGTVTLLTRVHGRGLDFKVNDKAVERGGGMLVIQTFLSEEWAEEKQIQGRTARQEKKGSYAMVLLASDLAKWTELGIPDAATRYQQSNAYRDLHQRRVECCNLNVQKRQQEVASAKELHDQSIQFCEDLCRANRSSAVEYLRQSCGHGHSRSTSIRFVLDISGSMAGAMLDSCVTAISSTFDKHIEARDHVAITLFNRTIHNEMDLTQKDGNEQRIGQAIERLRGRAKGGTALWDALDSALSNVPQEEHAASYWIVLLTDGDDGWRGSDSPVTQHSKAQPDDLRRKLREAHERGELGGLITIAAGTGVKAGTKDALQSMCTAGGTDLGYIESSETAKIADAFTHAAEMMTKVGRE
jgi:hypothetical protein